MATTTCDDGRRHRRNDDGNGAIVLLDLPLRTAVGIDGRVMMLQRHDFVGIYDIPSTLTTADTEYSQHEHEHDEHDRHGCCFHLVTVRPAVSSSQESASTPTHSALTLTCGFVLFPPTTTSAAESSSSSSYWIVARRYDPTTEEVSSVPLDTLTTNNLIKNIQLGQSSSSSNVGVDGRPVRPSQLQSQRIVPYRSILSTGQQIQEWKVQTNFISRQLLNKRGGLVHGDKIIPGCFQQDDSLLSTSSSTTTTTTTTASVVVDGKSLVYPPIPVLLLDDDDDDSTTTTYTTTTRTISTSKGKRKQKKRTKRTTAITNHIGTKRYLSQLSPSDRTKLLFCPPSSSSSSPSSKDQHNDNDDDESSSCCITNRVFRHVLGRYYNNNWTQLLGDVQLSYVMFLYIQCLSSLEHWRDLIAMLSMVNSVEISHHVELYGHLFNVLTVQVSSMEQDFFEDIEFSGDNFFVPAMKRLCSTCAHIDDERIVTPLADFRKTLLRRFPTSFADGDFEQQQVGRLERNDSTSDAMDTCDYQETGTNDEMEIDVTTTRSNDVNDDSSDEEDSDGLVVVPSSEVEASLARSTARAQWNASLMIGTAEYSEYERQTYPLLFAAKLDHEDILMACARILDEANDVSLVREAVAYLEEVEAKRRTR